jgi:glycosyltransferase involved in cell wall biosynthesis
MPVNDKTPIAVVMISLNEAHNMERVLSNVVSWAQEVFLVDSFSSDTTVDIALKHGVHVVQRRFRGFGDQWQFALDALPISSPWTMKLDPDELLSDELKCSIENAIRDDDVYGLVVSRRLWFMGQPLPVRSTLTRAWRTGRCRFANVLVNEHPIVDGRLVEVRGDLEHHDSPDLHHWYDKQNRYTTAEALMTFRGANREAAARLFGTGPERRIWLKKNFVRLPFKYSLLFFYHYFIAGAWKSGWVGYVWARLRTDVYRIWEYKVREMHISGRETVLPQPAVGSPDPRVRQY